MPKGIPIVKGHAYGNDFLLAPESDVEGRDLAALAQAMCNRHEGIGADGLMIYAFEPSACACGCSTPMEARRKCRATAFVAWLRSRSASARGHRRRHHRHAGRATRCSSSRGRTGDALTFRASMGIPQDIRPIEIEAAGEKVQAVALSVGNPQCVLLDDPLLESRLHKLGPAIEHHPKFPDRTNVSFAKVEAPNRVRILIWERGVGPTQASGTGACGAAVAAASYGGASRDVEVISPAAASASSGSMTGSI